MMRKGNARNIQFFFDKIKFGTIVGLVGFVKKKKNGAVFIVLFSDIVNR
jgi:hypothetical protein